MRTKTATDASEAEEEQRRIQESQAAAEERRRAAQSAVQDMTRGIQKKHEKELKELQFGAPEDGTAAKTVSNGGPKVGPQRSVPLRQRQEI